MSGYDGIARGIAARALALVEADNVIADPVAWAEAAKNFPVPTRAVVSQYRDPTLALLVRMGSVEWPSSIDPVFPALPSTFASSDGYSLLKRSFASVLSTTRYSAGSYRDITGTRRSAPADVARATFIYLASASSWVLAGLLIERDTTNQMLQSTDLSLAAWNKAGVTATATRITEDTSNSTHNIQSAGVQQMMVGVPVTYSFLASEVAGSAKRYAGIQMVSGAAFTLQQSATFDLATGIVRGVVTGGASAGMVNMGALGWRCWITMTPTATGPARPFLTMSNTPTTARPNYVGDGTAAINVSEVQCETGGLSSFVPTATASVSRSADRYSKALGAEFNAASQSVMFSVRWATIVPRTCVLWQFDDGTDANRISVRLDASLRIVAEIVVAGVVVASVVGPAVVAGASFKIAFAFSRAILRLMVNDTALPDAVPSALPTGLTMRRIGCDATGGLQPSGSILPYRAHSIDASLDATEYARLISLNEMRGLPEPVVVPPDPVPAPLPVPTPTPTTTLFSDDFATAATSDLAGWNPDIGSPWTANPAGASTGQVVADAAAVSATTTNANYYVAPANTQTADYEVSGRLSQTATALPGLLSGFSSSTLAGYLGEYSTSSGALLRFVRLDAGSPTTVGAVSTGVSFGTSPHAMRLARYVMTDRVRLRIIDDTTGQVVIQDDFSPNRITSIGFGGAAFRMDSKVGAPFAVKTLPPPSATTTIVADAARTWYNDPVSLVDGSNMYLGSVSKDGSVQVTKSDGATSTTTTLYAAMEIDDHNESTILKLPGGRVACFYSRHKTDGSNTAGIYYNVSTNPLPDIAAFNARVAVSDSGLATSYTLPFLLSDGKVRVFFRSGSNPGRPRKMMKADATAVETGAATWSITSIFETSGQRPYMSACQNGVDRIDFLISSGHPNEVVTALYHVFMKLVGGVEHFYRSDGTEIVGLPIDATTQGTLIDDATNGRVWNGKIGIGKDGHPRVLFTKYPSSTGARDIMFKDIEYWHARWIGSAWVKSRLTTGQVSMYPNENHYPGGMCFDGNSTSVLYLAETVNGIYEINKYFFNEAAGDKIFQGRLSNDSQSHNFRPVSPAGGTRPKTVNWLTGPYSSYTNYATSIVAP